MEPELHTFRTKLKTDTARVIGRPERAEIEAQLAALKAGDFEDWELDGMIRDCWIYYPALDCGGDIDRRKADEFKNKLIAELTKRGRDDLLSRLKDEAERRGL